MADTLPIPPFPAAEVRPSRAHLQRGIAVFRAELEAAADRSGQAILAHHLGRLFAHQQDFAAAAREELAATNLAAGFAAPLEALWAIAIRGRSRKNAETLLLRLQHIARTPAERERSGLTLAAQYLDERRHPEARRVLEACLEGAPTSLAGWILLEELAHRELDLPLARQALTGRASAAGKDEVESLLYERAARLTLELGELDEADALLEQALVTFPRWETLRRRERMLHRAGRPDRAALAALLALDHLETHQDGQQTSGAALPPSVLTPAEATTIRVRSALLFAEAGERERALEQMRLVATTEDAGPLEQALYLTLAERAGSREDQAQALARASETTASTDADGQSALALWRWILDRTQADGERPRAPDLRESAGFLGILLEQAERAGDARAVPDLLDRIARLTPRAHTTERTGLLLSATWIALATAQPSDGKRLLALARHEGAPEELEAAVELGLSRHAGDSAAELAALKRLTNLVQDPKARALLAWLTFRRALIQAAGPQGAGTDAETVRSTLRGLTAAAEPSGVIRLATWLWDAETHAAFLERSLTEAEPTFASEELTRAERIARLLLDRAEPGAWYEKTEAALRNAATDPLLAALAVRAAEDAGAPVADRVALLQRFAALAETPILAQAARLRALLLLQKERTPGAVDSAAPLLPQDQAQSLLAALSSEPTLEPLWMWLLRARSLGTEGAADEANARSAVDGSKLDRSKLDRSKLDRSKQSEPWLELERALRQVATSFPSSTEPASRLDLADPPLSGAARLLELLVTVAEGAPSAAEVLGNLPDLDDRVLGGLLLGAASHRGDAAANLAAARRFHQLAQGPDSLLAYAVTARLAGRPDEESRAKRALSEELGAPELLASAQLAGPRGGLDDRARRVLSLAEGTEGPVRAALAWELCEAVPPTAGSEVRGQALRLLGASLPGEIDGPLARLMAGYHAIALGNADEAIALLQPLSEILPDDSAVHLGLCAAALRAGRADVEAASSIELARREIDPSEAARLWERAGVLLEDALGAPDQAEVAFQSAMGRVPGSSLSFVRLYQFAHTKRDRPRMVELIDARLEAQTDEAQRIALLWEKARHSKQLGRRGVACRALEELLEVSADHLPALALLAELHLLDQRIDRAAPLLRRVAVHRATPAAQRESAGLHAVDLLERLGLSSEAMDLLVTLESLGIPAARTRRRKARLAARVGRWDVAAATFRELAEEDDDIPTRLEGARMLLAIERDHLRESANLKDAARLVLRDAPTDPDAAAIVVRENFHPDERGRLLGPAREATLAKLREQPLDLPVIGQMADFSEGLESTREERAWLGALALTGRLSDARTHRLEALTGSARTSPGGSLSATDLEFMAAPGQLGSMAELARIVLPKIAKVTLPDLLALGVSESMRRDPYGADGLAAEISSFATALGVPTPQVFVGAVPAGTILLLPGETPSIVLGMGTAAPLTAAARARVGYLLFAHTLSVTPLLELGLDEARSWLAAVARLTARALPDPEPGEVEEKARQLARLFSSDERAELGRLAQELERSDRDLTELALVSVTSAARLATLLHGDPSILRQLRELIPDVEQERSFMIGSVIQLLASPEYPALRTKLGLDLS